MTKVLFYILFTIFFFTFGAAKVFAIADPFSTENNKIGIHILFTSEVEQAAKLVNSNGGDWGYATIPIQTGDRDIDKWQKFMDSAKQNHVIPIIRISSENYFFDTKVWRKPEDFDVLDFANFLNDLDWPTTNKYIVVFNEVNRSDEWQGLVNPKEYAQILNYTVEAFKSLDDNFFIVSAGLDNASANVFESSINQYDFMREMNKEVSGIFGKIDGIASHSYPNPAFSAPPWITTSKSISSFKFERDLAEELGGKKLPVFITETGWSRDTVSASLMETYIKEGFKTIWSDEGIVAVTPFLLNAGSGPFAKFSLFDSNGSPNSSYLAIWGLSKVKGMPMLNANTESKAVLSPDNNLPLKTFKSVSQYDDVSVSITKTKIATQFLKWFFKSLNVL